MGVSVFLAGEIGGRILITKALPKKRITLPAYNMRSAAMPLKKDEGKAANEFDSLAIFLEDPGLKQADPVRTEMIQENLHFLPDFLGSLSAQPFRFRTPTRFFTTYFRFQKLESLIWVTTPPDKRGR